MTYGDIIEIASDPGLESVSIFARGGCAIGSDLAATRTRWCRRFFNLADLNAAIADLLDELNNRPMRHIGKSRRQLFEEM
ncbi:MAG: hypothetical protein WBA48_14595 [Xanthobacteraceae bacterium]